MAAYCHAAGPTLWNSSHPSYFSFAKVWIVESVRVASWQMGPSVSFSVRGVAVLSLWKTRPLLRMPWLESGNAPIP